MLPRIDPHQRDVIASDGVLVRPSYDLQGTSQLVLCQPGPSATLNSGQGNINLLLQGFEGAKVLLDSGLAKSV